MILDWQQTFSWLLSSMAEDLNLGSTRNDSSEAAYCQSVIRTVT